MRPHGYVNIINVTNDVFIYTQNYRVANYCPAGHRASLLGV